MNVLHFTLHAQAEFQNSATHRALVWVIPACVLFSLTVMSMVHCKEYIHKPSETFALLFVFPLEPLEDLTDILRLQQSAVDQTAVNRDTPLSEHFFYYLKGMGKGGQKQSRV